MSYSYLLQIIHSELKHLAVHEYDSMEELEIAEAIDTESDEVKEVLNSYKLNKAEEQYLHHQQRFYNIVMESILNNESKDITFKDDKDFTKKVSA